MTKWLLVVLPLLTLASAESYSNASKEVVAASDAWRQAMIKNDAAAQEKYMHPDLVYVHSNGRIQSKTDVIAGKEVIKTMDFSETTVLVYGTTALIKAKVDQQGAAHTAHLIVLHVWLKGPTGWQLIARQATCRAEPPCRD